MSGDGAVISGEAVEVEVRLARVGSRMLAFLIDVTLQLVLAWIVALVLLLAGVGQSSAFQAGLTVIGLVLVFVGYPVAVETLSGGRSAGKLAMGLRVVRGDGGPIRFRHALTRTLVGLAVEWPGVLIPPLSWLVCLGVMLGHPSGRRLGDLAAGTLVLHERSPASWGWIPAMPPALYGWASTLDLTGLDDDLALAVRHYLARNRRLGEPARTDLGTSLAAEVARQTTPPVPPGTPGWAYLTAVLSERHRRSAYRMTLRRSATSRFWTGLTGWPTLTGLPPAAGQHHPTWPPRPADLPHPAGTPHAALVTGPPVSPGFPQPTGVAPAAWATGPPLPVGAGQPGWSTGWQQSRWPSVAPEWTGTAPTLRPAAPALPVAPPDPRQPARSETPEVRPAAPDALPR